MAMCDTDFDGKCTVDEGNAAFSDHVNWDDPWEEEFFGRVIHILTNADEMAYYDNAPIDGFVTQDDLELEIQWAIDKEGLLDWLWDSDDGVFGNQDEQEINEIWDAIGEVQTEVADLHH